MSQQDQNNGPGKKQNKMFDQFAQSSPQGEEPSKHAPRSRTGASGQPQNRPGLQKKAASQTGQKGNSPSATGQKNIPAASVRDSAAAVKTKRAAKKQKRHTGAIIAITLAIVLIVSVFSIYTILANRINGENTQAGTLPQEVKTLPEYTGKGIISLLVCGLDYDNEEADGYISQEDKVGRTDLILYVLYDTINNKVNILQIPRDIYVGMKVETGDTGKMNGLYFFSPDKNNRMAALATVIKDQLELPVDYYLTIDMDAVKEIIDIMPTNSIRVYVPVEVSDPDHPEAVIAPGWRDFTSAEAEFFLRNRKSPTYKQQGDIMRLQMQQSFYSAMFREFTQLSSTDLLMWMKVLLYRVHTDMDPLQLGGLAQKALKLTADDLTFVRPPVSGAMLGDISIVSLVPDETADLLNEYFRPEGQVIPLSELNIQTLPVDESIGIYPANVRKMSDVQKDEPPVDIPDPIINY